MMTCRQKKTGTKARPGPAWLGVVLQDKPSRNLAGPVGHSLNGYKSIRQTKGRAFWLWTGLAGKRQGERSKVLAELVWVSFIGVESDNWDSSNSFSRVTSPRKIQYTVSSAWPAFLSIRVCLLIFLLRHNSLGIHRTWPNRNVAHVHKKYYRKEYTSEH